VSVTRQGGSDDKAPTSDLLRTTGGPGGLPRRLETDEHRLAMPQRRPGFEAVALATSRPRRALSAALTVRLARGRLTV
jgi:hypothetical protein